MQQTTANTSAEPLAKALTYQYHAWQNVLEHARAYGFLKSFGRVINKTGDGGSSIKHVNLDELDETKKFFVDNLLYAIDKAMVEDFLVGGQVYTSSYVPKVA